MICPACHTNHAYEESTGSCVQCGSDLDVHKLLHAVVEEINMNKEVSTAERDRPSKTNNIAVISQFLPSTIMLLCALFAIYVGMQFLKIIDRVESHRTSLSAKWSETGFEQLQQMNATIKQELDLILDQRRENIALQAQVRILAAELKQNTVPESVLPSIVHG